MKRMTVPIPSYPKVHHWDRGAYNYLGLESLHNYIEGWREGVDFSAVGDASGKSGPDARP
jgi:hypothetical protein